MVHTYESCLEKNVSKGLRSRFVLVYDFGNDTKVNTSVVAEAVHMADIESTKEKLQTDTEPTTTTTKLPETTTLFLPENFNSVYMQDVTTFTFDNATIDCSVKHAIRWQSLSIKINRKWLALEVTLLPSGIIKWSRSKSKRHAVIYDVKNSTDGYGSNVTLRLVISDVQCQDANTFLCILKSNVVDRITQSQFIVVGKPSDAIHLTLGPSIIEDQAFRITASWQGGYPIPWTNMSWTAIDKNNKSYNLADYGEYRDYELHVDDKFCQTTLTHSIVVFPKVHLNDTTVIVKPDIEKKQRFVDKSMEKYLYTVQPGVEKVLVLPLDYCKSDNKEESIRHPYTPCSKYVRCLPNNIVVQQCPTGTCFYEKRQQCA